LQTLAAGAGSPPVSDITSAVTPPVKTVTQDSASVAPLRRLCKRTAIIVLILALLLPGIWLCWNHIADNRLQSSIDQITARGEPLFPRDFAPPPLPDDQNAATYLIAATAAMNRTVWPPRSTNFTFPPYPPYGAQFEQMTDAAVKANPQTLALARKARQFDRAIWAKLPPKPAAAGPMVTNLNDARALANLLADTALFDQQRGDHGQAIERVRDLLHLADSVDGNGITLVQWLVSIGIDSLACYELQITAADHLAIENAQFPDSRATTQPIKPVRRQVILDLIHQLMDDQANQAAYRRAILAERMLQLDFISWFADYEPLLRPMFKLDAARSLDLMDIFIRAAAEPNLPRALAVLSASQFRPAPLPPPQPNPAAPRFSRAASSAFAIGMNRLSVTYWRVASERRAAAVSLALHLYRADHGHWPATLDELVPRYLPTVPADPFIASPTPIGYLLDRQTRPNGAPRPLLYFDTLGFPTNITVPSIPMFGWNLTANREWVDVTLWSPPPTTAPSGGS
jgi:hypothetical protein